MKLDSAAHSLVSFVRRKPVASAAAGSGLAIIIILLFAGGEDNEEKEAYHVVERRDFVVSIVEGGTLEAVNEIVVRNDVDGNSRIINIVPEGSQVKEGDLLVELDAAEAEDLITARQINYEKSLAAHVAAENALVIMESTVESETQVAELNVKFARMDMEKYRQLEEAQERLYAEIGVNTAQESLEVAKEKYEWSKKLVEQKFESERNLDLDRLAVINQDAALKKAEGLKKMLEEYDLKKLEAQYQSDLQEKEKELERVKKQGESKMAQARADLISAEKTLDLNKSQLEKMQDQLKATKIYSPSEGFVVYATSQSRFSSDALIEEGATVRKRQELVKIPDISEMKVELKVHESHINQVTVGLPAYVILDSLPDERFLGEVTKVGIVPDSQSRYGNPNLKVYSTEVIIRDKLPDVKPGVSARAEIIITKLSDVLTVPLQAVTTVKGNQACFVRKGRKTVAVPVEIGLFNNKFIEIKEGLKEGDRVLLAPPLGADADDLGGAIIDADDPIAAPSVPSVKEDQPPSPGAGQGDRERPPGAGSPRPGSEGGDEGRGGRGQGGGGDRRAEMLKRFDTDGDGQLSDEERKAIPASPGRRPGGG